MMENGEYKIMIEKRLTRLEIITYLNFIMLGVLTGVRFL